MVQYVRHRPESTLLYQVIERYYPEYLSALSYQGKSILAFVEKEFEEYLKCGRLEHGFLRVRCSDCKHEKLVAFSCKRRGFCPSCGARRIVDGAALLLDEVLPRLPYRQWVLSVPFPLRWLFARGPAVMSKILGIVTRCISSYLIHKAGYTRKTACTGADKTQYNFQPIKRPSQSELEKILYKISERTGRYLERAGLLARDMDQSYLTLDGLELDELQTVQAHSIHYRIAAGTWRGKKVFTLQTLPPKLENQGTVNKKLLAKCSGFSLHAGVAAKAHERAKLERLCRYIARPAVSSKRLSLTQHG
ncbi:MAG: transposase zinc-binding domain-containing protein, partial [Methylotenera sp.]